MKVTGEDFTKIQNLVGDVSEDDLSCVDCYVWDDMGIFIPSVGYCKYAIKPAHTHPSYSFIISFTGELSFLERKIEIPDNNLFAAAFEPDVPHEEKQMDKFTRYLAVQLSPKMFEEIFKQYSDEQIPKLIWTQFAVHRDILFYLNKFMSEYENRLSGQGNLMGSIAVIVAHYLVRGLLNIKGHDVLQSERIEIEKIIQYMHQNFGQKLTNGDLSKMSNMSESAFVRLFKSETGYSPMGYLINIRIEKAKKLLRESTMSITEVSFMCGFGSTPHFSSCFTKHMGISHVSYTHMPLQKI